MPPADRQNLTLLGNGIHAERGKPGALPDGDSEPQGKPMGRRVGDDGESEGRFVMKRIGVAPEGNSTLRASALTSIGSFVTRKSDGSSPLKNDLLF